MKRSLSEIETKAAAVLRQHGLPEIAEETASRCSWLEGVGYPGLKLLAEALADQQQDAELEKDVLGFDLKNVSAVFLAARLNNLVRQHGRLFLRNVRHGLYLVPDSVRGNYGIGCPVDPSFPLGGERTKDPYAEKLEAAARDGVEVDEGVWQSLSQ
jgi:hypothetical protein